MLQKVKRTLGLGRELLLDGMLYVKCKADGKNYADFYAARMDRRVKKDPQWGLNKEQKFQLDYLVKHGLQKDDLLLDFGCGAISAGRHFINYLNEDKYYGVDVSKVVIEEGVDRVARFDLTNKKPNLIHVPAGDISILPNVKFKYVWAQSVFTHMPPDEISAVLKQLQPFMAEGAAFYSTFSPTVDGKDSERKILKDWYFSEEQMVQLGEEAGYTTEIMKDWQHNDSPGQDRMAKFTLKA